MACSTRPARTRVPKVRGGDQRIVVVCDEGYASSLAAAALQDLGSRTPPISSAATRHGSDTPGKPKAI